MSLRTIHIYAKPWRIRWPICCFAIQNEGNIRQGDWSAVVSFQVFGPSEEDLSGRRYDGDTGDHYSRFDFDLEEVIYISHYSAFFFCSFETISHVLCVSAINTWRWITIYSLWYASVIVISHSHSGYMYRYPLTHICLFCHRCRHCHGALRISPSRGEQSKKKETMLLRLWQNMQLLENALTDRNLDLRYSSLVTEGEENLEDITLRSTRVRIKFRHDRPGWQCQCRSSDTRHRSSEDFVDVTWIQSTADLCGSADRVRGWWNSIETWFKLCSAPIGSIWSWHSVAIDGLRMPCVWDLRLPPTERKLVEIVLVLLFKSIWKPCLNRRRKLTYWNWWSSNSKSTNDDQCATSWTMPCWIISGNRIRSMLPIVCDHPNRHLLEPRNSIKPFRIYSMNSTISSNRLFPMEESMGINMPMTMTVPRTWYLV